MAKNNEIYNLATVDCHPHRGYEVLVKGTVRMESATLFWMGPGARPAYRATFLRPDGIMVERELASRMVAFGWLVMMAERHQQR